MSFNLRYTVPIGPADPASNQIYSRTNLNHMTTARRANISIGFWSLIGVLMSGYLSYWALWGPSCHSGPIPWLNCGSVVVKLIGLPTCVYGFFMFFAVFILNLISWTTKNVKPYVTSMFWLGIVGMLFSAGLSIYEIYWLHVEKLPACVYGLIYYIGIFVSVYYWRRSMKSAAPLPPDTSSTGTQF